MSNFIGIDFGTTNSVLAVCDDNAQIRTARFPFGTAHLDTFRTVLCFWQEGAAFHSAAGSQAITEYLKDTSGSRFIQSIKTYLASTTFTETRIFNRRFELEDLIALFLNELWAASASDLALPKQKTDCVLVAGRPVTFAGINPDDAFAQTRLQTAYTRAGFSSPHFAYEPQGAAYFYAQHLQKDARLLVADYGGGTSDFSVIECKRQNGRMILTPIAHTGVGIAGDRLDFRIIDHLISPLLGKGSHYKSFNKWLDMPTSYYRSFAAWHLLSLLKTPRTLREIEEIASASDAPDQIEKLHRMIEDELGYHLYRAVGQAKAALSSQDETDFLFDVDGIQIKAKLTRKNFNRWIKNDVEEMAQAMDNAVRQAGLTHQDIDKVFMTGGTSFVPAVRQSVIDRFDAEKMANGNEFTSVGGGLALMARDLTINKHA